MIATTTFVPLFVQGVLGGSPTEAGMAIAPMAIGWPIASTLGGRWLERLGYRPLVRLGFALTLLAAVALAVVLQQGPTTVGPRVTSLLLGLGLGFANTTLLVAVQASVDWGERGVATASTLLFRTLGGALSVGALGALLAARLTADPSVPPGAIDALLGPRHGQSLAPALAVGLASVLRAGLEQIFWLIAALAVAAFFVGLLFPKLEVAAAREPAVPVPLRVA
jgi:MFS family permease